jgi:sugar transferase (PEP-CTERM/EpsH1 system associated)
MARLTDTRSDVASVSKRLSMPLIAHIIYRLDVGGMENGIVNLLNGIPASRYRHAIICLTDFSDFRFRIRRPDVEFYALHKRPGKDPGVYWQLWRLLRRLRPEIVHTRNLPALDALPVAALAGVPVRVHGEHGREIFDIDGMRWKYRLLRRLLRPLTHRYIALSHDLETWLREGIGVSQNKLVQIYNGVDVQRFYPGDGGRAPLPRPDFASHDDIVIGTVGRMQAVKDQVTLAQAFLRLLDIVPAARTRLRLVIVGEGPLEDQCRALFEQAGAEALCWFAGRRGDIAEILRGLDVFVLPSLAEGISNTVLEAMATGLPVVATRVGGNAELVVDDVTGSLVAPADPEAMARVLAVYVQDPGMARRRGLAGRARVEREFSLPAMVDRYLSVYDQLVQERVPRRR